MRIASVEHRSMGHVLVTFADGSRVLLSRSEARGELKPGDEFPPRKLEVHHSVDSATSEVSSLEGQPAETGTEGQNEAGVAPESSDGPQAEGQQGAQEIEAQ